MTKGNELLMRVGSMLRRHYGTDARTPTGTFARTLRDADPCGNL